MVDHKSPKGKLCLICTNVYSSLGYDVKYGRKGGFADYKAVIAKQSGVHHTFLAARKAWIKSFNDDDEEEMRLKTKKRLTQVKETLELLDEESQGFSAPKKVFVEEDKWNVEVDGAFDQEKVVEEFIFGKKRKGIWKVVGREGVWDFKDFQGGDSAQEEC